MPQKKKLRPDLKPVFSMKRTGDPTSKGPQWFRWNASSCCVCFPRLLPLVVLLYRLANTNGNPRRLRMRSTGRGCSDASSCNSGCEEDVKTHKTVFMVHEISVVFSSRAYHQSGSGDAVGPRHIGTHSDCGNWYKAWPGWDREFSALRSEHGILSLTKTLPAINTHWQREDWFSPMESH